MHDDLAKTIDDAFEKRSDISPSTKGPVREAVEAALDLLDRGKARVAERGGNGAWTVNQWLKKAVLLSFRLRDNGPIIGAAGDSAWWDKVPTKFEGWDDERFKEGLMIADQAGSPRMGRDRRCGRTNHYARNSRFNRQWKPRTTLPPLSMSVSFVRRVIPSSV